MAEETLKDWFSKNDGKGWIDCKTGKPCGRKSRTKSKRPYPACRPTMSECNDAKKKKKGSKAISWKDSRVKKSNGGFIAKGCGKVMNNRRKITTMSQENKMYKRTKSYATGGKKRKGMKGGGVMKTKGYATGGVARPKGMATGGVMKTKGYKRGGKVKGS